MNRLLLTMVVLTPLGLACTSGSSGNPNSNAPLGDGFAGAVALDERTVILSFQRKVDAGSVSQGVFTIEDRTVVPFVTLGVEGASASGAAEVTLQTTAQEPGRIYTLTIRGLHDDQGFGLEGTLNFTGGGLARVAALTFRLTEMDRIRAWGALQLELTVDPANGGFSDRLRGYALTSSAGELTATVSVVVDARRTITRLDDLDPVVDRRAYAARVVTPQGIPASPLIPFEVSSAGAATIMVGLLPPPGPVGPASGFDPPEDTNPGDGLKRVRIYVDDRASRELVNPQVKCAFDAQGNFDVSFPQQLALTTPSQPRLYQVDVDVRVDPNRTLDGMDEATLPYIVILVNDGQDIEPINVSIVAPDEAPQAVVLPLGDATMTPVTFRIDAGSAFLLPDGSQRGLFTGESVFITGEWQRAADALGRNAGDSFSGGEQLTLQMKPDPDHPGLWFKTLWLPGGRPYGWKAVRCQTDVGCGPLNQRVASSGRAFATVMKNLATENLDAFTNPGVVMVDPASLLAVPLPGGATDYSNAQVYIGNAMGGEDNPAGVPNATVLFKQEVPDLAVVVTDQPLVTPIYVVGTWRDINLPVRPAEILNGGANVNLSPYDYDEGFIGRYPPVRVLP